MFKTLIKNFLKFVLPATRARMLVVNKYVIFHVFLLSSNAFVHTNNCTNFPRNCVILHPVKYSFNVRNWFLTLRLAEFVSLSVFFL